ncbi:zinc finger CCCH domain-containing protein 16-like isoform X2 [Hibiscus syriacus]|uniref:Zinc finger CCCH domain-containing protein 16-like isoform X2 n=1 Tax=Hibiscus syriacus TaxID=106335 RepID=A0A6A2WGN7_HIBSY|nr:zinc finger CCCH domain-containing protein 16-like [Hibiscus syriacus]KAE8657963.1 zinc finger CCCH domain-containing protein 16-like isoform X2 [Hibiscus syriacus]
MKKEPCRNFQRGSCQYGERCKFLHVTPQQSKSNAFGFGTQSNSNQQQKPNPFGFGVQNNAQSKGANDFGKPKSNAFGFGTQSNSNQQQKPNPFGFGVQNNAQSKGANDFGNKQTQFKNTWTRSSSSSGAPSSRQPDNQAQATNHRCNDPDSCKRIIAEDFEHERPLWKLTCYSHWKNSPCDIVGDVSYEELRAAAYDDAKRGLHLQSIIERERNLLSAKLAEFENLLRNPYKGPAGSSPAQQIPFPGATPAGFSPTQNNVGPSVSSFSQLGASLNTGFSQGPSVHSNNTFGQPTSFSNSSQSPNVFAANNVSSANAYSFGNQHPNQSVAASFPANMANFSNSSAINPAINQFSAAALPTQNLSSSSSQSPAVFNIPLPNSKADGQATTDVQLGNNLMTKVVSGDSSIWLKEKWTPGEIPEEAPPDAYV